MAVTLTFRDLVKILLYMQMQGSQRGYRERGLPFHQDCIYYQIGARLLYGCKFATEIGSSAWGATKISLNKFDDATGASL